MSRRAWASLTLCWWWALIAVVAVDALNRGVPWCDVTLFTVVAGGAPLVIRWLALSQDTWDTRRGDR